MFNRRRKWLGWMLSLVLLIELIAPMGRSGAEPTLTNVALAPHAVMTASGNGGSYVAGNANDGLASTRWAANGSGIGSWLRADFFEARTVHQITLKEFLLSGAYRVQSYVLQVSNDAENWTEIASGTAIGAAATFQLETPVTARYVQLVVLQSTGGPHIAEFEIYGYEAEDSEEPGGADPDMPIPSGLTAESGSGMVSLAWEPSEAAASYQVLRSAEDGGEYTLIGKAESNRYIDWNVQDGTAYSYVIVAQQGTAQSFPSESLTFTPSAPVLFGSDWNIARTATMSASAYGGSYLPSLANDGSVGSRWAGSGQNGNWLQASFEAPDFFNKIVIREFRLTDGYRSLSYRLQASNDGTEWSDIAQGYGIGPGKRHEWDTPIEARHVRLVIDTSNHSGGPHVAEFEIYQETIVPNWPEGTVLEATDIGQTSVRLQWQAALDPDGEGITRYAIYQDMKLLTMLSADTVEWEATGLASNTPYSYRIEAQNENGKWTQVNPSISVRTMKEVYYLITYADTPRSDKVTLKATMPEAEEQGVAYALGEVSPAHGQAAIESDGSFTYTPAAGYTGRDLFEVTGEDGDGHTRSAMVDIYVQGPVPEPDEPSHSSLVYPNEDGRLVYESDEQGNRIPDFSNVGYRGGDEAIPDVAVQVTLEPQESGDDTARIQAAIDQVTSLPADEQGFKGAVLLAKGEYRLADPVYIRTSGIVLRGEGQGEADTKLIATAAKPYDLIQVAGTGNVQEAAGTRTDITDEYVPVGARSFTVADASLYAVGDDIVVYRPSTAEWIHAIGMDNIPTRTDAVVQWLPGTFDMHFERRITGIEGNVITIDAPMVNALEAVYGGGQIYKYTFNGRIRNVGVENLRMESYYDASLGDQDENHSWSAIVIDKAEDVWVRDVTSRYFAFNTVYIKRGAKYVTVQDSAYLDGISQIAGGRRYAFYIEGQLNLVQRVYSRNARHDFSLSSRVLGPNVFLDGVGEHAYANSEPHHRYATGALFDNITVSGPNAFLSTVNRGDSGTGHGWSGAQMVFWNSGAPMVLLMSPPTGNNYAIGMKEHIINPSEFIPLIESNMDWIKARSGETYYYDGSPFIGNAYFESAAGPVNPPSLYLKQLRDRLTERLFESIRTAGARIEHGSHYPEAARQLLEAAIAAAQSIYELETPDKRTADAAAAELDLAIAAFDAAEPEPEQPIENPDNGVQPPTNKEDEDGEHVDEQAAMVKGNGYELRLKSTDDGETQGELQIELAKSPAPEKGVWQAGKALRVTIVNEPGNDAGVAIIRLELPQAIRMLPDDYAISMHRYNDELRRWEDIGGERSGGWIEAESDRSGIVALFVHEKGAADRPIPYPDMTNHWGMPWVTLGTRLGIVGGYPDGAFKPGRSVSRYEFVTMLMRCFGSSPEFKLEGHERDNMTRAEMAKLLAAALVLPQGSPQSLSGFRDASDIPPGAEQAFSALVEAGLIQGRPNAMLAPLAASTRAEALKLIIDAYFYSVREAE